MNNKKGNEIFIVDNGDDEWKMFRYLDEWCELSKTMDIASAFFEIGSLLALDTKWQKVEKIRLLMGDDVSKRTKQAFEKGLTEITGKLDESIENEKVKNNFLKGINAIINAFNTKQLECRVYRKQKFHAKAYISESRYTYVSDTAIVGSSNFTYPGLQQNIELNVQIRKKEEVDELKEWFLKRWEESDPVEAEILKTIERHTKEYSPFQIYLKSLYEYYRGHEITATEWENEKSILYKELSAYQKEGYQALINISNKYKGAFLCDGVGLGKTFIGLMLIERLLIKEKKRVVLIVPKSARESVWETKIKQFLPHIINGFMPFKIINHTDLLREKTNDVDWPEVINTIKNQADVIVIDEAHNFRNRGSARYRQLFELTANKLLFLLTATPINNSLLDLQHQIELFTQRLEDYFKDAPLGIHSITGHFRKMENALQKLSNINTDEYQDSITDENEAENVLKNDELFKTIVVQRSRSYAKQSMNLESQGKILFPKRNDPKVGKYSLVKVYGSLMENFKKAFEKKKPLLNLSVYYPYAYYTGDDKEIDPMKEGRQKQVVGLIKMMLLKRFESSFKAFYNSCETLMLKLFSFVKKYNPKQASIWEGQHDDLIRLINANHPDSIGLFDEDDSILIELLKDVEELNEKEFNITEIVLETIQDINLLAEFLEDLKDYKPEHDDKLNSLLGLLKNDKNLKDKKVIIFTEFKDTAKYLFEEFKKAGLKNVAEIDGDTELRNEQIVKFSPYYNGSSSKELISKGISETNILISTDVLSEGLNLQDATCIINYDIHWNPVRLMQRIGRVDRRLDEKIENKIVEDHPELKNIRGEIFYWNFLPPDELNKLLSLYTTVTNKVLKISMTFGIEGKKILTPEDDYNTLREFNGNYEGETTKEEDILLNYQILCSEHPELMKEIEYMPNRVFSGKVIDEKIWKGIFFCYRLPSKKINSEEWSDDDGFTKWYYYSMEKEKIADNFYDINELVKCDVKTMRYVGIEEEKLQKIILSVEKYINDTYLKKIQAPAGVKPVLKTWMEIS